MNEFLLLSYGKDQLYVYIFSVTIFRSISRIFYLHKPFKINLFKVFNVERNKTVELEKMPFIHKTKLNSKSVLTLSNTIR